MSPSVTSPPHSAAPASPVPRVRFAWIENWRADLIWYIGSAVLGLAIVPIVLLVQPLLLDEGARPRYALSFLGVEVPLSVALLVVGGWSLLLDGPHFWPTLARTFLDPTEWRQRGPVLLRSLLLFLLGPALVASSWGLEAALRRVSGATSSTLRGGGAFIVLWIFLGWAYYHVFRQHWGFVRLYRYKGGERDPALDRADRTFFHLAMILPLLILATSPWAEKVVPLHSALGLDRPVVAGRSAVGMAHLVLWGAYAANLVAYMACIARCFVRGVTQNCAKLVFLAAVVPVHLVPFAFPSFLLFLQPIVGVGHALQYQRIVWRYGRRKYFEGDSPRAPVARFAFRNVPIYVGVGLLFTLLLLRGPWVNWLVVRGGAALDAMLGVGSATASGPYVQLGPQLLWAFFLGFLFQRYYLDAKIWKLRSDQEVRRHLLL